MNRRTSFLAAAALALAASFSLPAAPQAAKPKSGKDIPTFSTDVAPILYKNPELEIWRGEPARLTLSAPSRVFQGNAITVLVQAAGGSAVPLATVTLMGPSTYEIAHTGLDGRATFRPAGRGGDTLTVTATHTLLQYVPAQAEVEITHRVFTEPPAPIVPGPRPRP